MKQLLILLILIFWVIGLLIGVYFIYHSLNKEGSHLSYRSYPDAQMYLSSAKLQEEIIFYLAKQLGIYGGKFEIVDVVSLDTHDIAGVNYILITLKAPDGKLCQITVSRSSYPWARWELNPENFSVVEIKQLGYNFVIETPQWMQDLGITLEQINEYYKAHPEMDIKKEFIFFDEKTGDYKLPSDWYQTVKAESLFKFEINKDKTLRIISNREAGATANQLNSYWKTDYPIEYIGPGYRAYLYEKIKKEK